MIMIYEKRCANQNAPILTESERFFFAEILLTYFVQVHTPVALLKEGIGSSAGQGTT